MADTAWAVVEDNNLPAIPVAPDNTVGLDQTADFAEVPVAVPVLGSEMRLRS